MFEKLKNAVLKPRIQNAEGKAYSLIDHGIHEVFGIRPTYTGINVSGVSGLYIPAVLQAVRLISESIGSLPCKVYRETADGKEAAKDHTAYRITHKRANDWTSAGKIRIDLTVDALIHGNGFARVIRYPDDNRPFALERIEPSKVQILEDINTGAPVYRVSEKSGLHDYHFTEILHLPSFLGKSPLSFGKEAIGLAAILERHGAQFFGTGARPSGVLTNEKTLDPDGKAGVNTLTNILKSFRKWQSGANSIPLALDGGWQYKQEAMASTDAQFLENRVFQINEIARVFGIPPHLLFELSRATWSNAETMGASFLQLCLRPWLDRWQDAYATVLLTEDEQDTHYFEFVVDDLLRADTAARTANMTALVTNRIMTPNEVRGILNMQPLSGGDELINPHTTSNTAPTPAAEENT